MIRNRSFWAGSVATVILSTNSLALAADFYFDSVGGDDAKDGTSEATAKKTFKLPTGSSNTVHIKRGSTFSGNLSANNVTIVAYGCGTRPIFNGSISVTNATVEGIKAMPITSSGIMVQSNGVVRDCESDGTNFAPTTSAQAAGGMGITVNGTNNKVIGNYVHDWGFSQSGGSMNNSGGAEGIMVMASNNEIAFNTVKNCYSPNPTLGGVEGGCMEIVNMKAGSVISNVSFHHNYCERSVGMWEGCSGDFSSTGGKIQENHGIIENVTVSYNVSVDAMWMYLLQPVNTDFKNVVFAHNTIIHTPKTKEYWTFAVSTDYPKGLVYTDGGHAMMGIGVDSDTITDSAGVKTTYKTENAYYKMATGFEPGTIIVKNNIFADTVESKQNQMFMLKVADHSNNIFIPSNAQTGTFTVGSTEKKVDLADLAFTADYRLTSASTPAIDQGVAIDMKAAQGLASTTISDAVFGTTFTQDIAKHTVPCGSAVDIGASEYCDDTGSVAWPGPRSADDCSTGGATGTGGTTASSGGSTSTSTTTTTSKGGAAPIGTGGTSAVAAGSTSSTSKVASGSTSSTSTVAAGSTSSTSTVAAGSTSSTSTVAAGSTSSTSTVAAGSNASTSNVAAGSTSSSSAVAAGSNASTSIVAAGSNSSTSTVGAGGQASAPGGGDTAVGVGGTNPGGPGTTSGTNTTSSPGEEGGCSCRVAGSNRTGMNAALASVGLALLAWSRRRRSVRR